MLQTKCLWKPLKTICNSLPSTASWCQNWAALYDNFSNFPKTTIWHVCSFHAVVTQIRGGVKLSRIWSSHNSFFRQLFCHFLCVGYFLNIYTINPTCMIHYSSTLSMTVVSVEQLKHCCTVAFPVLIVWTTYWNFFLEHLWNILYRYLPWFCMGTKFFTKAAIKLCRRRRLSKKWLQDLIHEASAEKCSDTFWTPPFDCLLLLKTTGESLERHLKQWHIVHTGLNCIPSHFTVITKVNN